MTPDPHSAPVDGGVRPSPNIWNHPELYEWENEAFDPDGLVEAAIAALHPLAGAVVVDIGCGTGFHLLRYAALGAHVIGLEPHVPLTRRAAERVRATREGPAAAIAGAAADLPFASSSVDVALARWAYFFGAGCEPGLAQVARVVRPGGIAAFLDNDATRSTFGHWFTQSHPAYDPVAVQRFWSRQGFSAIGLDTRWECSDRERFEAIVRIEFEPPAADRILAEHAGTAVDYATTLWWRRY